MTPGSATATPAGALRVLEIGGGAAAVATRSLADMGASVIKVEGPTAVAPTVPRHVARRRYLDTDKRSVSLDLTTADGRDDLATLLRWADIVVEATMPGELAGLGVGYHDVAATHPAVSYVSITPFGQTGPYAARPADDLVLFAMGGLMFISGLADRAPVVAPGEQSSVVAGIHAAIAALSAARAAGRTGRGSWVDVSIFEAQAALENTITNHRGPGEYARRSGSQHRMANPGRIFPAADGAIHLFIGREAGVWERFLDWLGDPPELVALDLADINRRWEHVDVVTEVTERSLAARPVEELVAAAQERHLTVVPVYDLERAIDNPQTRHLRLFEDVGDGPEAYRTLRPLLWPLPDRRPAPVPGQDTAAVLDAVRRSEAAS